MKYPKRIEMAKLLASEFFMKPVVSLRTTQEDIMEAWTSTIQVNAMEKSAIFIRVCNIVYMLLGSLRKELGNLMIEKYLQVSNDSHL